MLYVSFFAAVLAVAAVGAALAAALATESFVCRLLSGRRDAGKLWAAAAGWPWTTVLLLLLCAAALTPAFRKLLIAVTTAEATGVTGAQASKVMHLHYLPEQAEDVNYSVRFDMALADFRISEADFRRWWQGRDCQPVEIGQPPEEQPIRVRHGSLDREHALLIKDGLVCQLQPQQRHTLRIVFDRQQSRAYYEFRAW